MATVYIIVNDATSEDAAGQGPYSSNEVGLHLACMHGHIDCGAQLLLAAHAAVDQPYNDGNTPLHSACLGGHIGCV